MRRGALAHLAEPRRRLTTLRTAAALTVGRLGYAAPQRSISQSATASPRTPFSSALSYQRKGAWERNEPQRLVSTDSPQRLAARSSFSERCCH